MKGERDEVKGGCYGRKGGREEGKKVGIVGREGGRDEGMKGRREEGGSEGRKG